MSTSVQPCTLTQHIYQVRGCCSNGSTATAGHPHIKLYQRLVDFSSIRADGGSTSRCRFRPHGGAGFETERQEECTFSSLENHLSRRSMGFDRDAGTIVPCSYRVDPHLSRESQRRPVTHCQTISEIVGSDGSCVQRDTSWPAVHETPTVVAQDQGIFPKGQSTSNYQGHAALPPCLRHVEETLVLESGPGAGSSWSPCNTSDGCIPHWLGCGHEWPPCPRSVERSPFYMAYQLSRDASCASSIKIFLPDLRGHHVLVRTDNTAVVSYINQQGGLRLCPLYKLAHQILLWSQDKLL